MLSKNKLREILTKLSQDNNERKFLDLKCLQTVYPPKKGERSSTNQAERVFID